MIKSVQRGAHAVLSTAKRRAKALLKAAATSHFQRTAFRKNDLAFDNWRLLRDTGGELCIDGVRLRSLIAQFGSPLHVVDAQALDANAEGFLKAAAAAKAGCSVFYSYKTNPVPGVLQRLHGLGIGAEVISEYELWLALSQGVSPEMIVYNGPAKSDRSLENALEHEIGLLVLNNREEIPRVLAAARRTGRRPKVAIRIVLEGGWGGQFGEPVATGAALETFEICLRHSELRVVGVHVHRGTEITGAEEVVSLAEHVLAFVDRLRRQFGLELEILDFGGSLGCRTTRSLSPREIRLNRAFLRDLLPRDPKSVISPGRYTATLVDCVASHYDRLSLRAPRIFLEPGRALTANAQLLLSSVIMTKSTDQPFTYAIMDAGINLAESMRTEYHQIFPLGSPASRPQCTYRLAGPICTPGDVLVNACRLPELSPGDPIAIMDAGAYFVPFSTCFSFPRPAIVMLDRGNVVLLRRSETFDDLVARDQNSNPVHRTSIDVRHWGIA